MTLAFKFRLYPNEKQEEQMAANIEACRHLWNMALTDRKEAWEYERLSTTYEQQCLMLTVEAKTDQRLDRIYSQVGQDVLKRLDKAFKAFFEHRAEYPRFKKYHESGSFTYPQAYNGSAKPDVPRRRLYLSKIGNVVTVFHRPLPTGGRLKICTVKRETDGTWYACLVYDDVAPLQDVHVSGPWRSPIGVDRGLISLITKSDGEKVDAPRFLRKAEKKLKHLQKILSKKEKGSENRAKARHRLAVKYVRVANQRKDLNHKLSANLMEKHDLIGFEDLGIRNMMRNRRLAKSVSDAGWGQFVKFAEYKAVRAREKIVVRVSAPYSTQECWFCGLLNPVALDVREFACGGCGRVLDRDTNAGRIVLKRAIAKVGQDRHPSDARPMVESHHQAVPNLKPVETGPLPIHKETASLVVEAGTKRGGSSTARFEACRWNPPNSFGGGCHSCVASSRTTARRRRAA